MTLLSWAKEVKISKADRCEILCRFMPKLRPSNNSDCWLWQASKDARGYGLFRLTPKRLVRANRVSYALFIGPLKSRQLACHSCDTPSCVNPFHIYAGSSLENIADRERRGRSNRRQGETHGNAKLDNAKVRYIRTNVATKTQTELAKELGVSIDVINKVVLGKTWRHV